MAALQQQFCNVMWWLSATNRDLAGEDFFTLLFSSKVSIAIVFIDCGLLVLGH